LRQNPGFPTPGRWPDSPTRPAGTFDPGHGGAGKRAVAGRIRGRGLIATPEIPGSEDVRLYSSLAMEMKLIVDPK